MVHKRLLRPERLRRVPSQFSWVDHRLVREHHLERLSCEACALYLFLVTVGDADGLSYYGDASIGRRLHIDPAALERARRALVAADLIAFELPLYQVLSLDTATPRPREPTLPTRDDAAARQAGMRHLGEILRDLGARR
jgi:hypothetical protein